MAITFNADEILQIAERIERNGAAFYSLAAERLKNFRDIFHQLARQEEEHLAVFSGMRANLSAAEREPTVYDPEQESALYLQALADREVFLPGQHPDELFSPDVSLADIIKIAVGKEKDSIVFYTGMKQVVPEKFGGEKMTLIIREEFRHITVLRGILKTGS
ncbi:MAG: ferritin family protein [Kiritimatiellae bacterium]|nr:ferritin family protein [Kiritimatiellia bacterium]